MSKMIPSETTAVLRAFHNTSINNYGIECSLYILNNPDDIEDLGLYANPTDTTFDKFECNVWIEFSPDNRRLRKLGIYSEDAIPIIARFPTEATEVSEDSTNGSTQDIDVIIGSYVSVNVEYVPGTYDTDSFEVVDIKLGNVHDAVLSKIYVLAPRRVKSAS